MRRIRTSKQNGSVSRLAKLEQRQARKFDSARQQLIDRLRRSPYCSKLAGYAEENRRQPTKAEAALRELLDANLPRLGLAFGEQVVIGRRIADFVITAHKLVVEVDGPYHLFTLRQDAQRTHELNQRGHRVIRFTNDEVLTEPHRVLERILRSCGSAYELADDYCENEHFHHIEEE